MENKRGKSRRMFGKWSIRNQMILLVTCFLLMPLLLFTYFFNWFMVREVRRNVEISVENSMIVTDVNLENLRITIINACISAASDEQTAEFLDDNAGKSEFEKNIFAKKIENMVTVNLAGAEIGGAIVGLNGETFNLYRGADNPLALDFVSNSEKYKTITWSRQNTFDAAGTPYIVCTCPVYRNDTAVLQGISAVALAQSDFQAIINRSKNYESYEAVIVDDTDTIVSHQNEAMIGRNLETEYQFVRGSQGESIAVRQSDGKKFLYFDRNVPIGSGWRSVTFLSYDEVFANIDRTAWLNHVMIILLSCCTIVGVFVISGAISRPIIRLRDSMAGYPVKTGDLEREGISSLEVDSLYDSYARQMNTIEDLIEKIESDKQKLSDLQFQSLQAQINPHFLFNTLNNIKMMAFIRGCQDVGQMIAELGRLLEVSIYFNTPLVAIGEELDYVTSYVNLQNIHFEGRMVLDNQIPESLWKYQIVKFTLQPILENSIKHGFDHPVGGYRIELSAEEHPESIVIRVKDNGSGFNQEKLREIRQKLLTREETKRVGLYNVNERIKLSFGEEFGLEIDSVEEEYTVVTVRIPKIEGERNAEGTDR